MKKGVSSMLFKQSSTKSFHIVGPLIEILCLVLFSFKLVFENFKIDDFVEYRWKILWKRPLKIKEDLFLWTTYINAALLNILSLYKFSTCTDLKSSFVCSNYVLLWTIWIACFCWVSSFFRFVVFFQRSNTPS